MTLLSDFVAPETVPREELDKVDEACFWMDLLACERDPECVAVGCGGDCDELREYPCNCFACRRDYEIAYPTKEVE